jgi:hypothetical protein
MEGGQLFKTSSALVPGPVVPGGKPLSPLIGLKTNVFTQKRIVSLDISTSKTPN